jgi:hypothetical protein
VPHAFKTTESKIEKKVVEWCRKNGVLNYKFASPSNRGVPDRVLMFKGKVMFLELKRPGNEPTALQDMNMTKIRAAGVWATWANSYEDATTLITAFFQMEKMKKQDPKDLI